jgi:hypothetical protein
MESVRFIDLAKEIREDLRGFSFYPLKGRALEPERLPEDFHLVSIGPGQVRGNHLHPGRWEWLLPLSWHRLLHLGAPPRRPARTHGLRPPPPHLHSSRSGPRHAQSRSGTPLPFGLAGRENGRRRRHRAVYDRVGVLWRGDREAGARHAPPLPGFISPITFSIFSHFSGGVRGGGGGST